MFKQNSHSLASFPGGRRSELLH